MSDVEAWRLAFQMRECLIAHDHTVYQEQSAAGDRAKVYCADCGRGVSLMGDPGDWSALFLGDAGLDWCPGSSATTSGPAQA